MLGHDNATLRATRRRMGCARRRCRRFQRVGFGFRRFTHYRTRVLLYAGRPNWDLLDTIDPAQIR